MQRARTYQRPTPDGSRTLVIHDSAPREVHPADPDSNESPNEDSRDHNPDQLDDGGAPRLVLNLQGGGALRKKKKEGQRVVWKEDVIDNEGCGKKKSKICCIYHKPRKFDESSDESSDESDCEGGSHRHNHASGSGGEGSSSANGSGPSGSTAVSSTTATVTTIKPKERNAYEIQPHKA